MTANTKSADKRRNNRVTIPEHPTVLDAHSGKAIGQLVNLSADGLMIASAEAVACDHVCQMCIPLIKGNTQVEIRIGAESLWSEDANDSGIHWTGFHIIDISPEDQLILDDILGY
jgi:hypothetical protein